MSVLRKPKLTAEEYLVIERAARYKSEFYNGEMFAMAGANRNHNRINENLSGLLFNQLRIGPCQSFSRDQRVLVDRTGLYCYPNLIIVCGEPQYAEIDEDTLVNPRVIVEIFSDSTEKYDRTTKFRHYQQIPSVQEIILVAQDEAVCERYVRQPDDTWNLFAFVGLDAVLEFKSVPLKLLLGDIYEGVKFPPPPPEPTSK